jgi:polycystin 2
LTSNIDTRKRELTKLKNENTLRLEKINWIQVFCKNKTRKKSEKCNERRKYLKSMNKI